MLLYCINVVLGRVQHQELSHDHSESCDIATQNEATLCSVPKRTT